MRLQCSALGAHCLGKLPCSLTLGGISISLVLRGSSDVFILNLVILCEQVALWDVLPPSHMVRYVWDLWMLVLVAYISVMAPFLICFDVQDLSFHVVDLIIDGFFAVDIYLNFRTAYIDNRNRLVVNHRDIAVRYLKGWFVIDLVSTIPWAEIFTSDAGLVVLLKVRGVIAQVKQ